MSDACRDSRLTAIQYITPDGNDGDSGNTFYSAKASIAAAIATLGSGGGRILVGAGNYAQTAQIAPSAPNIAIIGIPGATTLSTVTPGLNMFRLFAGASGWTFQDLIFDGGNQASSGIATNSTVNDVDISHCTFLNMATGGGAAVHPLGVSHMRVRNCNFINCQGGVLVNSAAAMNDIEISDCRFDGTNFPSASMIYISSRNNGIITSNVRVVNNHVLGEMTCQTASGGIVTGMVVQGNTFTCPATDPNAMCISMSGPADSIVAQNRLDMSGLVGAQALEIVACDRISVAGNVATGLGGVPNGITLHNSRNCVISGNVINGFASTGTAAANQCISIYTSTGENTTDNVISGNTCLLQPGSQGAGIRVRVNSADATGHTDRNTVVGNVIRGQGVTTSYGIDLQKDVSGSVDRNLVDGNIISNVTTAIRQNGDTLTSLGTNITA